jgi:NAD-reducing hydrogenase large subunit
MMRKYGQEVIKATAGKKIHGTGAIPGGINKNLSIGAGFLLKDIDQMMEWSRGALKIAKDYTVEHLEKLAGFGSFDSNHLSSSAKTAPGPLPRQPAGHRRGGQQDLRPGGLPELPRVHRRGGPPWSYMKFPFIKSLGPENGWYRVGPLARINTCDFIDTPEAEAARKEFMAVTDGKPNNITMAYHWARMIEPCTPARRSRSCSTTRSAGHRPGGQGRAARRGRRPHRGPRGTLFHHYRVNDNDQVVMANLIVSTTTTTSR